MSNLTITGGDLRYLRTSVGGTLSGLLIVPTASFDDTVSPMGSVINKQFVKDNLPTLAVTDLRYALLTGATFSGPVLLDGETPENPRSAVDRSFLDSVLAERDPALQILVPDGSGAVAWTPMPHRIYQITLSRNTTLSIVNHSAGATYRLLVIQPATQVVPNHVLTFSAQFSFPSGLLPTLTSTAGATDLFTFVSTGQRLLATGQTDYI